MFNILQKFLLSFPPKSIKNLDFNAQKGKKSMKTNGIPLKSNHQPVDNNLGVTTF